MAQGVGNFAKGLWGGRQAAGTEGQPLTLGQRIKGAWGGAKQGYQNAGLGYAKQLLQHANQEQDKDLVAALGPYIQKKEAELKQAYAQGQQPAAAPAAAPAR